MDSSDDVYYKIQMDKDGLEIICLQWFDEHDYDKNKWLFEDKYATEEEAQNIIDRIDLFIYKYIEGKE